MVITQCFCGSQHFDVLLSIINIFTKFARHYYLSNAVHMHAWYFSCRCLL